MKYLVKFYQKFYNKTEYMNKKMIQIYEYMKKERYKCKSCTLY